MISEKKDSSEVVYEPTSEDVLAQLSGVEGCNFSFLRKELGVQIGRDKNSIVIRGREEDLELVLDLLQQLDEVIVKGYQLNHSDFKRAFKNLAANQKSSLITIFTKGIKIAGSNTSVVPKGSAQREYIKAIEENDITFAIGPAGTGKTFLAVAMALAAFFQHTVKKVVLCRPAVEAGERLGFLPGDMVEKVNPYLRPLYDALHNLIGYEKSAQLIEKGAIEVAPLAFMRGRTLSSSFVILDEAQNTTIGQMKMFLTRLGEGSKCVVTGDITQIDLPDKTVSGLSHAVEILRNIEGIKAVYFSSKDVVRHHLVAKIIDAYKSSEKTLSSSVHKGKN
ncbi:MAG: PhoH family protein [Candidatus Dadabacteria bacterium]|nr:MAG: PhoH family protein [Candidatus Dadabacteria bacterium]